MGRKPKTKASSDPETTKPANLSTAEAEPQLQEDAFVRRNIDEAPNRAERISLKLKDDGLVDWDSHRGDTRDKIIKAFANDPEALKLIGLQSPLLPQGQGITEENARAALAGLAQLDAMLIPFAMKFIFKLQIEPKIAQQAFTFTDPQLTEMAPRAARLANKYSSAAMLKYQDEIALAGMFSLYVSQQIKTAVMMQVQLNMIKAQREQAAQTAPPIPPNGHDTVAI